MDTLLLDWRYGRAATVHGYSMVVHDATDALRVIERFARGARYGEYRITRGSLPPVYTSAALIRAWRADGGDLPMSSSKSLWRRESQRAAEIEELNKSLRSTLHAAARRGLIPQSTAAEIARLVKAATDGHYDAGDVPHGPLSR